MNPITQDLADYIVSSGFKQEPSNMGYAIFFNEEKKIIISMNGLQVMHWRDDENDRNGGWVLGQEHIGGILDWDLTEWAFQLNLMRAVSIRENNKKVRNDNVNRLFQPLINSLA